MFDVPNLFRRILPDPVALLVVEQSLSRHTAVIFFIPTDGIEHKLSVIGAVVFVRLAGNDIVG